MIISLLFFLDPQIVGVTAGDAGTYTAFADNGLGPPATAAVSLSVDPASGTNVPASVIELEPGRELRENTANFWLLLDNLGLRGT